MTRHPRSLSFLFFLLASSFLSAQIGVQTQFYLPATVAESADVPDPAVRTMWSVGLAYTMRNSKIRLEVVPQATWLIGRAETLQDNAAPSGQGWTAGVDLRAYPLDFRTDCLCPTFDRRGDAFKKGLFVEAGGGWYQYDQDGPDSASMASDFYLRAGAGMDIGLTSRATLTPGLRIQYMPGLHPWGPTDAAMNYRPVWFQPYLQLMWYLGD